MKKIIFSLATLVAVLMLVFVSCKKDPSEMDQTISVNDVDFVMVFVQGGSFTMGCTGEQSGCYSDETPAHEVSVSKFHIGKYPVTQQLWKAVMGDNPSAHVGDNLPVENVTYNDALSFISKLTELTGKTFRLPTEAEWEYAARGGYNPTGSRYSGGNYLGEVGWYSVNSDDQTQPVGRKQSNGTTGIYDMSGNVWEWCSDWYNSGYYGAYSSYQNPTGPTSGTYRVIRGGAYNSGEGSCRVSYRGSTSPNIYSNTLGFRLVMKW